MDVMNAPPEDVDRWNELTSLIPLCGCGKPSDTMRYVISILQAIRDRSDSGWIYMSGMAFHRAFHLPVTADGYVDHLAGYFLLYMLDHLGLTEHGGNVMACWLTEKGHRAIDLYTQLEASIVADCFDDPSSPTTQE